jgi:alcohol dehydrogenase
MPEIAYAAVLVSAGQDLQIRQFPLKAPEKDGILVKIDCCTICGSDIHSWQGRRPSPIPGILGHEIVGTITQLGENVAHDSGDLPIGVGDRITWTLIDVCGNCYFCRDQTLVMKCRHLKKYGHESCEQSPHLNGGFAQYCYITAGTRVIKLPAHLPDEIAAPANCAVATVVAGLEAAEVKPFETILIQGAGALGIYAAALARHTGCSRIIVTDVLDHRLQFIKAFGATNTINVEQMPAGDIVAAVRDLTGGLGVDCCLEVAGLPELIPIGLKCLRIGGRLIEIGNSFPGADFTFDAGDIVWRRLTLKGIHNYHAGHLQQAIDLLALTHSVYPYEDIVSHRFGLEQINEALRLAASGNAIRVAVRP